jgi:rubrerythrin
VVVVSSAGAQQWDTTCNCHPGLAAERHTQEWLRKHSEVTRNNHTYFIRENRVGEAVDAATLRSLLEQHDHVLVCNVCGRIKGVDD